MMTSKSLLMVFDFDHTIVNGNTDGVVQVIHGTKPVPKELKDKVKKIGWTKFMQEVFNLNHEQNVTKEQYYKTLDQMEFTPGYLKLLKTLQEEHHADLIIISDSNTVFIDYILRQNQLEDTFIRVYTNPARFEADGRLSVEPYHHQTSCDLSGSNLCKGHVLEQFLSERKAEGVEYDKIGYAGDGSNDFCPMLRLKETDVAFPRTNYSIGKHMIKMKEKRGLEFKAETVFWKTGDDIINYLGQNR